MSDKKGNCQSTEEREHLKKLFETAEHEKRERAKDHKMSVSQPGNNPPPEK